MRVKFDNWVCCTLAFVTDVGMRRRSHRNLRLHRPHISLTNLHQYGGSSSGKDSNGRRILIQSVSNAFMACMVMMKEKSANAACLSGDIRSECIGIYKLPINAAESPYVATPEKLKIYAPDLQWVPPTPYPPTYTDALNQLKFQRQQLAAAQDHVAKGKIEEAGLALLDITPKVSVAGIVIIQTINKSSNDERNLAMKMDVKTYTENNDGNPSSSPKAITLEMKAYRIKTTLDELLGYLGETDVLLGQGLRGELGVSAPAQLQILSSLSSCSVEFDNLISIIPIELSR